MFFFKYYLQLLLKRFLYKILIFYKLMIKLIDVLQKNKNNCFKMFEEVIHSHGSKFRNF